MYTITDLTRDNTEFFADYIGGAMAENIGRINYRGFVLTEGDYRPVAGMIWRIKKSGASSDAESIVEWIRADKEDAFNEMLASYKDWIGEDEVVRSGVVIPAKEGKEIKNLLKTSGFSVKLTESDLIVARLSVLSEVNLIKKFRDQPIPDSIKSLDQIPVRAFRSAILKCDRLGKTGICDDLADLSLRWFEEDVSCVSEKDGEINGMFLFHKKPAGLITAQILICFDNSTGVTIPLLMRKFIENMYKKYDPDTKVGFDRHNILAMRLSEKLLPSGFGTPIYSGTRDEK